MMLRQIQHFQIVVQENSFTEAAELCHISQSGIRVHIHLSSRLVPLTFLLPLVQ